MNKSEIRANILKKRDEIPADVKKEKDHKIHSSFQKTTEYLKAHVLLIYVSFGSEIDTLTLIKKGFDDGKRICVPVADKKTHTITPSEILSLEELEPGAYGILEPRSDCIRPVSGEEVDLTLVPGLAFDKNGYRIGYGGGFYDRFFEKYPHGKKIALCYDFQIQESVPINQYDIPVEKIISESNALETKK